MRLRATTKIRNDHMVLAREKMGLSQIDFAKSFGIPLTTLTRLEALDYPKRIPQHIIDTISGILELSTEQVVPQELIGIKVQTHFVQKAEIESHLLLDIVDRQRTRLIEKAPDQLLLETEERDQIKKLLNHPCLSFREREILKLRYGFPSGTSFNLLETARIFKVTRERIRQIEAKALRKLKHLLEKNPEILLR